jgi:restriction system protein
LAGNARAHSCCLTGPYKHTTDLRDGLRHIRKVEWLCTDLPRTAFSHDIFYSLGIFMICNRSADHEKWTKLDSQTPEQSRICVH